MSEKVQVIQWADRDWGVGGGGETGAPTRTCKRSARMRRWLLLGLQSVPSCRPKPTKQTAIMGWCISRDDIPAFSILHNIIMIKVRTLKGHLVSFMQQLLA